MVLRQRDSMVVATTVPAVGAEIAEEEMASTEGQRRWRPRTAHAAPDTK